MTVQMSLVVLAVCWFLFVFPVLLFLAMILGARLIAQGKTGAIPGLSIPRFSVTKRNGQVERDPAQRLPDL